MNFNSLTFLIFFVIFSLILSMLKTNKAQKILFLLANILFYAYWDFRFLFLLFGIIIICYYLAILTERKQNPIFSYVAVLMGLLALGVFKYARFFIESFSNVFGIKDYVTLNIVLPLGISFYVFQAISYVLDVKNKKIAAEKDFIKLAVYISFFIQITSGPIVKAHEFLPQLDSVHIINRANLSRGVQLFLLGLTKKVVFADRIGVAVNAVYNAPAAYSGISILLTILAYSIQIYCDFSGYSDMAIGIATIWDFDLGQNFNMPYLAKNPSDFWRRWHISLSTWFRDYVYIP